MTKYQGYATHFDLDSKQWIPLSEDYCLVELSVPPALLLSYSNGIHFLNIPLNKGFQHKGQASTSVVLYTPGLADATAQTYGFHFGDERTARAFEESLVSLSKYGSYESNFMSHAPPVNRPSVHAMNPVKTWEPSSHSKPMFQNFMGGTIPRNMGTIPRNSQTYDVECQLNGTDGYDNSTRLNGFVNLHGTLERIPMSEEEGLCERLSVEITAGQGDLAEKTVAALALKMAKIVVTPLIPKKTEFNILIQIHNNEIDGGTVVTESVDPYNTSIAMLKYRMFQKHQFPMDIQVWIVGKRIAKDHQTLATCGVKATGTTIFLYLKSVEKPVVKPVKPVPINRKDQQVQTDERITNYFSTQFKKQNNVSHQWGGSHAGPNQSGSNLKANNAGGLPRSATNVVQERLGWDCEKCTFRNLPTFEGCSVCTAQRPDDYKVPDDYVMLPEEVERLAKEKRDMELFLNMENQRKQDELMAAQENYNHILLAMNQKLLPNQEEFECSICMDALEKGEGVMLRDCLHCFCKDCLVGTIENSDDPEVHCPFNDGFACPAVITSQEIEELLTPEEYGKYLSKSLQVAERGAKDSFHCRSANCTGWCFYEDDVNIFKCPICVKDNCLTCKAIHPDQTCKEYQDDLKLRAENDEAAKKTQAMLDELINRGEAMHCPQCKVILQKKQGCDWMRCTMCRCEICWATKGPRWGPKGNGDTSGGCKCGVNGRCTPTCGNCH